MYVKRKYMSCEQDDPGFGDILFSSISALLGSAGQTNYSAANAGIDALVEPSRRLGRRCASVQWGAWGGLGGGDGIVSKNRKFTRSIKEKKQTKKTNTYLSVFPRLKAALKRH